MWDKADRYRQLALQTGPTQAARDRKRAEHLVLIDHIASGDHAAAAAVMRAHIDTSLGATAVQRLAQPQG